MIGLVGLDTLSDSPMKVMFVLLQAAITADSRQYNVFTFLEDDTNLSDADDEERDKESDSRESSRPQNSNVTSAVGGKFGTQSQETPSATTETTDGNGNEPTVIHMHSSHKGQT